MALLLVWLRRLIIVVLAFGFCELLLPEGELRRFARVVLRLLVTLLLFQPLVSLFHQRFAPNLWPLWEPPATSLPTRAAARIEEAGLAALQAAEEEETARAIRSFCREELGLEHARVEVKTARGERKIVVGLEPPADLQKIRKAICIRYGLPETAVEVMADE
ncbi:MAG: stage III sporulation protein AF [Bacillota bacterium]